MAVEEASFKTSIASISAGFISDILPPKGAPSKTINGSLPAFIEL